EINQVIDPMRATKPAFSQRATIAVILERHRTTDPVLQLVDKWHISPPGQIWRVKHNTGTRVKRPWRGDANRHILAQPSVGRDLFHLLADAANHGIRTFACMRRGVAAVSKFSMTSDDRHAYIGSTQIDADNLFLVHVCSPPGIGF